MIRRIPLRIAAAGTKLRHQKRLERVASYFSWRTELPSIIRFKLLTYYTFLWDSQKVRASSGLFIMLHSRTLD